MTPPTASAMILEGYASTTEIDLQHTKFSTVLLHRGLRNGVTLAV